MTQTSAPAIQVSGLTKSYNGLRAVDQVSFEVRRGEIYGFLGPNGAGKTSTINMLTGLVRPTAGAISYFGQDYSENIRGALDLVGVVPSENNLYEELDGFENLTFCASLYGMAKPRRERRAKELLEIFGLTDAGRRKFGKYSRGMQRRLTIAAGIIHEPPLLFLDEPTTGIDVASARQTRQLIGRLNEELDTTIVLTTHYIEEAERLCDRIAIIVEGKLVKIDTVEALLQDISGQRIVQFSFENPVPNACEVIEKRFSAVECESISPHAICVRSRDTVDIVPYISYFESNGIEVSEARRIRPSLEDVFVRITGLAAEEMKKEKEGKGK